MKHLYIVAGFLFVIIQVQILALNSNSFDRTNTASNTESQPTIIEPQSSMASWAMTSVQWSDIPQPDDNPITEASVELGAMLFFDPRLSESNMMSCATCHHPKMGFSDGIPLFTGDHGNTGPRRTQTAQNLAWNATYFWDGRASSLEEQALMPIHSPEEMNQEVRQLLKELSEAGYYPYFQEAFGKYTEISPANIGKALASFQRTLVSVNSPFDRYMAGDQTALSSSQVRGMALFEGKARCATCHFGPNFTDDGFHNIGIDINDTGRYKLVPLPSMKYAFKTPGLRDVAYRAPYFHDGSAATLNDVIELYDQGGAEYMRDMPNIAIVPLGLTDQEKTDLVAFLEALSGTGVYDYPVPRLPVP